MSGIETWGVSLILRLQSFRSPALDLFFKIVTSMGDERFFLLLLPLVYWCVDKRLGMRLAVLVMLSNTANIMGKYACQLPRPPLELHVVDQDGYGFPSGHTQGVTVACGYLAYRLRKWYAFLAAALLILAVGLSRLYLGVHFPHDVLGGLVLGLAALLIFVWATPPVADWWNGAVRIARYVGAICFPLAILALWPLADMAGSLGALAGLVVGGMIERESVGYAPGGSPWQRILRFLLGGVLVGALYAGLKAVPLDGVAWRFVRYAAIGLFAGAAAPWLFVRLRLAHAEEPAVAAG